MKRSDLVRYFGKRSNFRQRPPRRSSNAWQPAYLALARRARLDGVRTILTGEGGDEWLTVTSYYAADLIRRGAVLELAEFLGTLRRSYQINPFALVRNVVWRCGLRPLGGMALHRLLPGVHDAGRLKRWLAGDPAWLAPDPDLRVEHRHRAAQAMAASDPSQGFYIQGAADGPRPHPDFVGARKNDTNRAGRSVSAFCIRSSIRI